MYNTKDIIQAGEEAKFQISIEREGFSMHRDDFEVLLSWGMRGGQLNIRKEDMMEDERGNFFFAIQTGEMVGLVTARTTYYVADEDSDDGVRQEVELSPLCFVNRCMRLPDAPVGRGLYHAPHVTFTRQHRSGLRSLYYYLADRFATLLRDKHGRKLRALKTT